MENVKVNYIIADDSPLGLSPLAPRYTLKFKDGLVLTLLGTFDTYAEAEAARKADWAARTAPVYVVYGEKLVLTDDQVIALRLFASAQGRCWKAALREAWMSGNYPTGSILPALQTVRNNFGPSWLVRFTLAKETRVF